MGRDYELVSIEGRNVVIEALRRQRRRVHRVLLDDRARSGDKVDEIIRLAARQGVRLERVPRKVLDRQSETGVHNGVIAWAEPLPSWTVSALIDAVFARDQAPFLVLVDEVSYEHNLGAILRSAMGAGVHGVIVPVRRGKGLSPVVARVAMGGAEVVPLIREGLSSALATIRRAGIPVVGADMDGQPCWEARLSGPIAIVLGGEDKGLSPTLRRRCDAIVGVPLASGLDSLNVSVSAGVLLFEKVRQDRLVTSN